MTERIIHLPRMRTLDECYEELKNIDNNTSITKYFIRQLVLSGAIPVVMAGRKRLINLDKLIEYLAGSDKAEFQHNLTAAAVNNKMRRIEV